MRYPVLSCIFKLLPLVLFVTLCCQGKQQKWTSATASMQAFNIQTKLETQLLTDELQKESLGIINQLNISGYTKLADQILGLLTRKTMGKHVPTPGKPIHLTSARAVMINNSALDKLNKQPLTAELKDEISKVINQLYASGFQQLSYGLQGALNKKEPHPQAVAKPLTALSASESYLSTLGKSKDQIFNKIHEVLTAPPATIFGLQTTDEQERARKNRASYVEIYPSEFDSVIDHVISLEKQYPNYYALYNGNDKAVMFLHLFTTYLAQLEYNWNRDDFFIARFPHEFYPKNAETAADYIQQNAKPSALQISTFYEQPLDIMNQFVRVAEGQSQFDMTMPVRTQLLSVSPSFISGVDDTNIDMRRMLDGDFPAWESAFYYFATNLSWTHFDRLEKILQDKIEKYCPQLFTKGLINDLAREYIKLRFSLLPNFLLSKANKQPENQESAKLLENSIKEEEHVMSPGFMYQILVPKNIIDKVAYLSWQNGIVWQRKINNIGDGWNDTLGAYTKLSPLLDILTKDPQRLGRSIHLLQVRLIFKDLKYLFDPSSPIKMNIITTLPESLMRSIKDIIRSLAEVVFGFKRAQKTGNLTQWAETINLKKEVERLRKFQSREFDNIIKQGN